MADQGKGDKKGAAKISDSKKSEKAPSPQVDRKAEPAKVPSKEKSSDKKESKEKKTKKHSSGKDKKEKKESRHKKEKKKARDAELPKAQINILGTSADHLGTLPHVVGFHGVGKKALLKQLQLHNSDRLSSKYYANLLAFNISPPHPSRSMMQLFA